MKLEKISFNYSVEKLRGIKVHSPWTKYIEGMCRNQRECISKPCLLQKIMFRERVVISENRKKYLYFSQNIC